MGYSQVSTGQADRLAAQRGTNCPMLLEDEMPPFSVGWRLDRMRSAYLLAKKVVIGCGYGPELRWQANCNADEVTESYFLREYAWVTLCCGMRERIIRAKFAAISQCFHDWDSARRIMEDAEACRRLALTRFAHSRKIGSIIQVASMIDSGGFAPLKQAILAEPLETLQRLPYMGPATSRHLAKNLGLPFAKPDRHLMRIADALGYQDVQQLCNDLSRVTGDPVQVVDLALWRFATIYDSYKSFFEFGGPQ